MEFDQFIASFSQDQQAVLKKMILCTNGFSVDWFPELPASTMTGIVLKLHACGWISHDSERNLCVWTSAFPKQDLMTWAEQQNPVAGHQNKPGRSRRRRQEKTEKKRTVTRTEHLEILSILDKAVEEEKRHKLSAAVDAYDRVLETLYNMHESESLPESLQYTFIHVAERRSRLSLFFPRINKMIRLLHAAKRMAESLNDQILLASLELMIGQHYWVALNVKEAMSHWRRAWDTVEDLNDASLVRQSLKLKILDSQGNIFKAIDQHERLIGNIESFDEDFSLFTGMSLSCIYTDAGMPQRGLGICESIRKQYGKKENKPMLALSYMMSGTNLLEIGQVKRAKICFEKSVPIAQDENIFSIEFFAKLGLICIACLEGNREAATEIYCSIRRASRWSWFSILNYYALFETFYRLFGKDVLSADLGAEDFLNDIALDDITPMASQVIQRLRIILPEGDPTEKIARLKQLEEKTCQNGETFDLAKTRIEIARLYAKINRQDLAQKYASAAWKFIKPIARDAFPEDLLSLLSPDDLSKSGSLSDLVIAMGNALVTQDNLEGLLTNVIASLSQMTGSERSAIFIKDLDSADMRMVASRNLFYENILEEEFRSSFNAIQAMFRSGDSHISEFEISDPELIDTRKAVIVPLILKDQVLGVLYQDSRFFSLDSTPERNNILSALASQVALAIDRARAHDEIAKLNKRLIEENLYYIDEKEEFRPFGEIIGSSKGIRDVQRLVRKVAPTQSAVLIHGETGVGKELVARAIHRESPRKDQPFIRVNCAALPESLIDSELFGHEKGAFTGAIKTKAGRFELAHQGTIFLDEVSELPLPTQSRLLRVLQEKEFQRVGGTKTLHSDFRLITATNKDLRKEVEAGRFREDLFYRLNVYPIVVPPLRERREDIPQLATHFLRLFSSQSNKPYTGIKISEMDQLKAYGWPGNIRELSNVMERAVISDAKPRFADLTVADRTKETWSPPAETMNYKDVEKKLILDALKKCGGVVAGKRGAAELLGMKRPTLLHRMKKLGIKVEHQRSFQLDKSQNN